MTWGTATAAGKPCHVNAPSHRAARLAALQWSAQFPASAPYSVTRNGSVVETPRPAWEGA